MREHTEADDFCIAQLITNGPTAALVAALESALAQRTHQATHHDDARSGRAHFAEVPTGSPRPTATLTTSPETGNRGT